jgi:transketolase N-terminal domain/subunit
MKDAIDLKRRLNSVIREVLQDAFMSGYKARDNQLSSVDVLNDLVAHIDKYLDDEPKTEVKSETK